MRPYLAILKDSVREAIRSRTLPFLLVFFTLVLAVLAPLGLRDETAWRLQSNELIDAPLLAAKLRRDAAKEGEQPGDRVLAQLSADVRKAILSPAADDAGPTSERLRDALNVDVLTAAEFYDETAFESVKMPESGGGFGGFGSSPDDPSELEALLDEGPTSLPPERLGRLNRLLLSAAFPQAIAAPDAERVFLTYGPWDVAEEFTKSIADSVGLELNRSGVRFIARFIMEFVAGYLAGPIGVLIALLVTAALIPQTFEGGAIDLLLSKPVSRTVAFLTKFAGGCVFVGLAGLYLCGGLWLIAGLRLGVWDAGLVAASGLLVVQFAVFYSVSAAVGVLWQNPIVCVMAAGGVWALSFVLNVVWRPVQQMDIAARPAAVVAGNDEVFKADAGGWVTRWNASENEWTPALYPTTSRRRRGDTAIPTYRLSGPEFVPQTDTLAALEATGVMVGAGGPPRRTVGSRRLYTATAENDWEGRVGIAAPPLTTQLLFRPDGTPLFAGRLGVFTPRVESAANETSGGFLDALMNEVARQTRADVDQIVEPPDDGTVSPAFPEPFAAAIDPRTGDIAIYAGGVVRLYPPGESEPSVQATLFEADGEPGKPGGVPAVVLATGDGGALAVTADGTGVAVAPDGTTSEFAPVPGSRPRGFSTDLNTGRLALATHDGPLWVGNVQGEGSLVFDDVSAAGWGGDGALWVGTGGDEVTRFEADGDAYRAVETLAPPTGVWDDIVRFGLTPLHYLLPDSIGLGETLSSLFSGDEEEAREAFGADLDLRQPVIQERFWGPLIHNLAFTAVMLGLTCWHVARTDF
ncbi:ABC transporter permease [Alienimonas chondri]|uniref:ABC transporter permease n=1 Tax=Alienimonas chondri TaxID=2681879 RepID=A0ABX1V9T6_9PLAN|nr:ABC transporter permease [Alienimonas chondri]NNJ24047.1 hypothetical protein [Alienimonas chondri]